MSETEEAAYERGIKQAYRNVLGECLRRLERDPEASAVAELHDARNALNSLCEEFGFEFDPDLHLGDMIENVAKQIGAWARDEGVIQD